jgi:hypothetical protein
MSKYHIKYTRRLAIFGFVLIFTAIGSATLMFSSASTPEPTGDLNNDGVVNIFDLGVFLGNFGKTTAVGDLNGDGVVNIFDLGKFLGKFGKPIPPPPPVNIQPDFYGINGNRIWSASGVNKTALLSDMHAAGVSYVRLNMDWRFYETTAPTNGTHHYSFGTLDNEVLDMARAGLRVEPMLSHAPDWAQRYPTPNSPPSQDHMDDWLAYVQAIASRYGPNGSLWAANPSVTKMPAQVYEIWNEENAANGSNWSGSVAHSDWVANTTAPAEYADLFRQTYAGIKSVDSNSKVIMGAVTGGPSSMGNEAWIDRVMAADPTLPMDGIGLHPYAQQLPTVYQLISDFRGALGRVPKLAGNVSSPATLAPIYITEVGWAAQTPDNTTWTNQSLTAPSPQEATRAADIRDLATNLPASPNNVVQLVPWAAVTDENSTTDREKWFGIWNLDGTRKPSAQGYAEGIAAYNSSH